MVPAAGLSRIGILTGPTSTGKTGLALQWAREITATPGSRPIEIINADSLLVYRGMDIGTAKPSRDELESVPHHLIDIRDPHETFTAGEFYREALRAIDEIESRGARPLIVGGTGFYLKALLHGLWPAPKSDPALRAELETRTNEALHTELQTFDPAAAAKIGPNDRYRLVRAIELYRMSGKTPTELAELGRTEPDPRFSLWVIDRDTAELQDRITLRTRAMLEAGLIDEVQKLRSQYSPGQEPRALSSVGYAETIAFLDGRPPGGRKIAPGIEGLRSEIELSTRQLVKSQRTWFRGQKSAQNFILDRDVPLLKEEFFRIYG